MALPASAVGFLNQQVERVRALKTKKRIVFPEGNDPRVLAAADRLAREGLLHPILIAEPQPNLHDGVKFVPPDNRYSRHYYERRRSKGVTEIEAAEISRKPLYFSALMVAANDADGFVGGAANTTGETVRAALHCIGTQPGVKTVSSFFVMAVQDHNFGHNGLYLFADCGIVIDPTAVELAEIAIMTARNTKTVLDAEPKVALLSFSTMGSAKHEKIDKIQEALKIIQARAPELNVDGELQADAAIISAIGASKSPGSTVAGQANTLIFPDLNSGNIAYKLTERLGAGMAVGPILQGLAKPANDLSRGCNAEDIYTVALISALQSE
jgi:phosphate acetyltransferase